MSALPYLPHFAFFPKDFIADAKVTVMSPLARGAYIFLLCHAWNEDPQGTLPDDDDLKLGNPKPYTRSV
jgi:uncharacterized protein YdaU (DUF1376 family)